MDDEWEEFDPSKGSFLQHTVAGSVAGVAEHVLMFPIDTYKVSANEALQQEVAPDDRASAVDSRVRVA